MHIDANGLRLWVEVDGPADGEPVLLISGAMESAIRWPSPFLSDLVAAGYRVVRFDNRGWGRSEQAAPGYDLIDMADDVADMLTALEITQVHVLGQSMGGMIAQEFALKYPDVVRSLTLLSTTPGIGDSGLPLAHDDLLAELIPLLMQPIPVANRGRAKNMVQARSLRTGTRYPFDAEREKMLATVEVEDMFMDDCQHGEAIESTPSRLDRLSEIVAPTLIVHGGLDHVYVADHAVALAVGIPNSMLWFVDGLGHEFPEAFVAELSPRFLDHLRHHPVA